MSDYSPTAFLSSTRLPDDIVQEIFIWYVNDDPFVDVPFLPIEEESEDDDDSDYSVRSSDEISSFEEIPFINHLPLPFVVSHVCSAWRRVALSTPRLWSNVCIRTFGPCSKRLATEWLLKAGSCPLFITIFNLVSDSHFDIYDELREFLSAYNIKSLELPLLSQTCPLLPLLLAELPDERIIHLESLSLTDLEYGRNEFLFLDDARYPFLRELQLIGRFVGDMIIFPWISLRHLDASTALLPMMQCLHILRDSVSLEVCYLGVSSDTGSESSTLATLSSG
ncbi:hypothetical protein F5887DRAFT_997263 [Amanita rubescens]|nr:hypothetical protein F5887DRAFT_997263 [Amanita rubescens]